LADESPDDVPGATDAAGDGDAGPPGEAAPASLSDDAAELLARLEAEIGDAIVEHGSALGDLVVRVRADAWRQTAEVCRSRLDLDYLSFVSGIDWMPAPAVAEDGGGDTSSPVQPREQTYGVGGSAGRLQVFAHVESTRRPRWGVTLKADVADDDPHLESWVPVYPGADWHERETWEMFGVAFDGHPSLRHLYLPSEFEGHPLRKDHPLLAREVTPWPGLVDVEGMPGEPAGAEGDEGGAA
jgi:NADH-quinone oxidoreductase subunit C